MVCVRLGIRDDFFSAVKFSGLSFIVLGRKNRKTLHRNSIFWIVGYSEHGRTTPFRRHQSARAQFTNSGDNA